MSNGKVHIVIILITIARIQLGFGQHELLPFQFHVMPVTLNPGATGATQGYETIVLSQLLMPTTTEKTNLQSVIVQTPIGTEAWGVGVELKNSKEFNLERQSISVKGAYRIRAFDGRFAFGMEVELNQFRLGHEDLIIQDPTDDFIPEPGSVFFQPNISFGFLYSKGEDNIGLSATNMINTPMVQGQVLMEQKRSFLCHGSKSIRLRQSWDLKSSFFINYMSRVPLTIQINELVVYQKKVWFGLGANTGNTLGVYGGIDLQPYFEKLRFPVQLNYSHHLRRYSNINWTLNEIVVRLVFRKRRSIKKIYKESGNASPVYF